MADFSLADLKEAFASALRDQLGAPGAKLAGGAAQATQAAKGAETGVTGLLQAFGDVAKASAPVISSFYTIGENGKAAATVLGDLAKVVPGVGGALSGFVGAMEKGREQINAAGRIGIGGNNIPEFMAQTAAAGKTMGEHTKAMQDSRGTLSGLAGTAQGVSKGMLELQKEAQSTKVGQELKKSSSDFVGAINGASEIMLANSKININDQNQRKGLADSSAELAAQIDQTARATGKSREAIEAELKERLKSPEAMLAMNQMSEQQRQQFIKTQAAMADMGPTMGNLAQTIASGARLSPQDKAALNALGPAAGDFQRAIRMQQAATTDAQKQQADAALQAAKARIQEFQSSKRYADIALSGGTEVSATMKKMFAEGQEARASAGAKQREMGPGATREDALKAQREQVALEQRGRVGQGPQKGAVDTGQIPTRKLNEVVEQARINSAGAAENLNRVNKSLAGTPEAAKAFNASIDKVKDTLFGTEKTPAAVANRNEQFIQKGAEALGAKQPTTKVPASAGAPGTKLEPIKRQDGSPGIKDFLAGGDFNKMFENFGKGTPAILHNKEVVATEQQMKAIVGKVAESANKNLDKVKDMLPKATPLESKLEQPKATPLESKLEQPKVAQVKPMSIPGLEKLKELVAPKKPVETAIESKIKVPELPKLPPATETKQPETVTAKPKVEETTTTSKTETSPAPTTATEKTANLDDVVSQLAMLNKSIAKMTNLTESINEASAKTARHSSKFTGNRAAA